MTRSIKKTPKGGNGSSKLQKRFKEYEHRAERSKVRSLLKPQNCSESDDLDVGNRLLPDTREYGNEWASPRDGKTYWMKPREDTGYYRWGIWIEDKITTWFKWMRK